MTPTCIISQMNVLNFYPISSECTNVPRVLKCDQDTAFELIPVDVDIIDVLCEIVSLLNFVTEDIHIQK